jgi:hypothetical protein
MFSAQPQIGNDFSTSHDSSEKIRELLASASPQILERYAGVVQEKRAADAARIQISSEMTEIRKELEGLYTVTGQIKLEEERMGRKSGKNVDETDAQGNPVQRFVPDPTLQKLEARIAELEARKKKLSEWRYRQNFLSRVEDAMASARNLTALVPEDLPTLPEPTGTPDEQYKADYAMCVHMVSNLTTLINLPKTTDEMKAPVVEEIEALAASGKPVLAGHSSGNNFRQLGQTQVAVVPKIGWPTQMIENIDGTQHQTLQVLNGAALFAYVNKDALLAKVLADIDADYNNPNAIPADEKAKRVADLTKAIWDQSVVVEMRYLETHKLGSKLLRPKDMPAEIILGCKPFGTRPTVQHGNPENLPKRRMVNPGDDLNEADFEDDGEMIPLK